MKERIFYLFLATLLLTSTLASAQRTSTNITKTKTEHDARMEWWHEAKFGMFIHWGLYAIPGRGEKVMNRDSMSVVEYAKLATQFNPVKFNAEEWVQFAKDAGMKYIVITAKHHDGFAMYDSKVSSFNIVDATPFKRDPLKELADACAKSDIKFGVYYSEGQDWHHPGGGTLKGAWDPAQKGDYNHYVHGIAIPQIKELQSDYKTAVIWFDAPPKKFDKAVAQEFIQAIRGINPETIINSRLTYSGNNMEKLDKAGLDLQREIGIDYLSYPDRGIPETPATSWSEDWETCMTLNNSWGYTADDKNWKSPQTVVQMLTRVVNKGGNFLLNFGPNAEGEIPAESVAIMKQVGAWLRTNGEAVYGVRPSNLKKVIKFPAVQKGKRTIIPEPEIDWLATERPASAGQPAKIYLNIFNWPAGKLEVKGISGKVDKAYFLANPKTNLQLEQDNASLTINLPKAPLDKIATVVCLEMK